MRAAAFITALIMLVCVGTVVYEVCNADLKLTGKLFQRIPAVQRQEEFAVLRTQVERGALPGIMYSDTVLTGPEDYDYYIYTIRLQNSGLIAAEDVEVTVTPIANDILMYAEEAPVTIAPGTSRDVWCVLLTKSSPHSIRDIHVTYYLWGNRQEVKMTYENAL